MQITGKFIALKDRTNQTYYGIEIKPNDVETYITHLRLNNVPEDFISQKLNRDHGAYHITVANTMVSNKFKEDLGFNNLINNLLDKDITFDVFGIGYVQVTEKEVDKQAWFVVCESNELQAKFSEIGIFQDYHITVAFNPSDVFRVRKNQDSIIYTTDQIFSKNRKLGI